MANVTFFVVLNIEMRCAFTIKAATASVWLMRFQIKKPEIGRRKIFIETTKN